MAISEKLFLAILAMDAYNRGYGAGMQSEGATAEQGLLGTKIGTATIGLASETKRDSLEVSASFYAQSYTWNGKTVISYRGTDNIPGGDFTQGWSVGAGNMFGQAELARSFFQTVTGQSARVGREIPCYHVFHMA
jgi:hypothetical protein